MHRPRGLVGLSTCLINRRSKDQISMEHISRGFFLSDLTRQTPALTSLHQIGNSDWLECNFKKLLLVLWYWSFVSTYCLFKTVKISREEMPKPVSAVVSEGIHTPCCVTAWIQNGFNWGFFTLTHLHTIIHNDNIIFLLMKCLLISLKWNTEISHLHKYAHP
jgi:hypothetical protein